MKKNDVTNVGARPAPAKVLEDVWVDFVENELDSTFQEDLSLLLVNSQADKQQVETITKLRGLIKGSDDVVLPEDGRIYEALHDRIMAATANMKPGTAPREVEVNTVTFMSRFNRKRATVGASSLMGIAIALFAWFGANNQLQQISTQTASIQQEQPNEAAILAESAVSGDSINDEVLGVVGDDEFFADAASQKIAAMSDQDYAALVDDLRN
jgi:hypothetical protein